MIEILWHGRGGQGAFTAARLLGAACSMQDGRHALAFPSFGPERRGAPMRAFTKIDSAPVGDRSACKKADFVVYLDETLLGAGWEAELKEGGRVLVNTRRRFADARLVAIDADGISRELLGRAIPNTVFLGALAALCELVEAQDVCEAIRQYMPAKLHEKNLAIVERVLATRRDWTQPGDDEVEPDAAACAGTPEQAVEGTGKSAAAGRTIPTLRNTRLDPAQFAHTTCYEAGHLVSKNAGWRSSRPVLDEQACTRCLLCYMQCPDGTVYKVDDEAARGGVTLRIDYDFCKGCGVCAKACRCGAIRMAPEHEEAR